LDICGVVEDCRALAVNGELAKTVEEIVPNTSAIGNREVSPILGNGSINCAIAYDIGLSTVTPQKYRS
jgi:hypothetical protein